MKNRVFGKGQNFKFFQFLTQNISARTNVENPKIFFRTTNLLENMQNNFDGPILNKNTSHGLPPPPRELTYDLREIDIKCDSIFFFNNKKGKKIGFRIQNSCNFSFFPPKKTFLSHQCLGLQAVQKYFPEQDLGDTQGMGRLMTALSDNLLDAYTEDSSNGRKRSRKYSDDEKNPWDT